MKRTLLLIILATISISCRNTIATVDPPKEEKVEVRFSVRNESVEIVPEEVMKSSKSSSDNLTAIQIYQRTAEAGSKYKPFSYGLWDDLSNVTVKLNKGYIYKFEVTFVPLAKQYVAMNDADGSYRQPFVVAGTGSDSRVGNEFIYHASNYLSGISLGSTAVKNSKSYTLFSRPLGERFYGEKSEITITQATEIAIDTKRVTFGLKYDIIGFISGEVRISLKNAPDIVLTPASWQTKQDFVTFQGSTMEPGSWVNDDYKEFVPFTIFWKKSGGSEVEISSRDYNFQRKTLYNVKIDLTQAEPTGGFNIKLEEGGLVNGGDI